MTTEVPLMKLFLANYRNQKVRLFRRSIFDRNMQDLHTGRVHHLKSGIVGQCDVYGFIQSSITRPIEIEFKGAKGLLSKEQKAWRAFCSTWSIPYIELRAVAGESDAQVISRWSLELDKAVSIL